MKWRAIAMSVVAGILQFGYGAEGNFLRKKRERAIRSLFCQIQMNPAHQLPVFLYRIHHPVFLPGRVTPMREPTFSERMGLTMRKMQIDTIDVQLKNSLWNALLSHRAYLLDHEMCAEFLALIWKRFFRFPADDRHDKWDTIRRTYFSNATPWTMIYEFVEFVGNIHFSGWQYGYNDSAWHRKFEQLVNEELENNDAGYRFIGGKIAPITNPHELDAVDSALNTPLPTVSAHIQKALDLLSDKTNPDYGNSIKESLSAVESLGKILCKPFGMEGQTLSPLVEKMTAELGLQPHLRDGFKSIYKHASDEIPARHGAKEHHVEPEQEDARFMLIACSAFVNYITEKAHKQGKLPG